MPQKIAKKASRPITTKQPAWKNILLALSLVPLIAGALLIVLWAFDIILWQPEDTQLTVAVLFIFLSFAVSNLVQGNWLPAAGWLILMIADGILLSQIRGPLQYVALGLGAAALVLFGIEIVRRLRKQNKVR